MRESGKKLVRFLLFTLNEDEKFEKKYCETVRKSVFFVFFSLPELKAQVELL